MNKKRCNTLLPLVQLLPAVAAAAAVLFALPRTVPVLAAVPERPAVVMEQPVEAASVEAEEEALPKLPYADGVYVGSSRGYGGAVRVQVTMENGSITEVEILDASHETKQFLRRAKRLLTTVVDAQSWEVDAVSEATYTSRGILGAVQNALTGEVVNNPLPPQPKPAAPLVVEEFTAPSTYLDGIYTAEAIGFEGKITVQVTVAEDKITDITVLSTIVECVDKIRDTATSHDRIFFVEVMGRDAGFLAQNSAIASGAEAAIIPEDRTDADQLETFIGRGFRKTKNSSIVIVTESPGNKNGGAMHYADRVKREYPGYDVRVSILGHLQRGGAPSANDRILASRLGEAAIQALMEDQHNIMVGIHNNEIVYVPFDQAIKNDKPIDKNLIRVLNELSI